MLKVGILGAGIMGAAVARFLTQKGVHTRILVRRPDRASELQDQVSETVTHPMEASEGADLVLSFLPDDQASKSVWFGSDWLTTIQTPPRHVIEMSTLSLNYVDAWNDRMQQQQWNAFECPVTGSRGGAESGSLVGFAGASEREFPEVTKILNLFMKKVVFFGARGNGMRFKLCYNEVGACLMATFAESMFHLEKQGISLEQALEGFDMGGWTSAISKSKGPALIAEDYADPAFKLDHMLKDLAYLCETATPKQEAFPMASQALQLYRYCHEQGHGSLDFAAVRKYYQRWDD